MDWVSFGKRLAVAMIICIPIVVILAFVLYQVVNIYSLGMGSFLLGLILIIFGACLKTPFIEGIASFRYAANPQQTRDTARHFSERREEQTESGTVLLVAGAIIILFSLICFLLLPLFPF